MAIGSLPNYEQLADNIELSDESLIKVDENGETKYSEKDVNIILNRVLNHP